MYAGTVTNVKEAMAWLSYTYLYVRMLKNPLPYGVSWQELTADPRLDGRRHGRPAMLLSFDLYPPCVATLTGLTRNRLPQPICGNKHSDGSHGRQL